MRILRRTPVRTFVLYPLTVLAWELIRRQGRLRMRPAYLPLMLWGYLQYRLCGAYRTERGGGGPGPDRPPDRLVTEGPYAYTRNPMYMGHIMYLSGLTLALRSWFGALITSAAAVWFHRRVITDEKNMAVRFGPPYLRYMKSVKRWIPGLF